MRFLILGFCALLSFSSQAQDNMGIEQLKKEFIKKSKAGAAPSDLMVLQAQIMEAEMKKSPGLSQSIADKMSVKGHMQFRTESSKNRRGIQGVRQTEQSLSRLRTYFQFKASRNLKVNFTPQATKGFGADDSNGNITGSGINHTEVDFFEANFDYQPIESLSIKLGRQEIVYGDSLVIGARPWANPGQSFDGLKIKYSHSKGWSDLFYSKISNDGTVSGASDDTDLLALYNSFEINQWLKPLDIYYFYQEDGSGVAPVELNMFGFRLKGGNQYFFYRTENAIQQGANLGDDAYQYNLEIGGKLDGYSLSGEYGLAGPDYLQLYPSAHGVLGFADVLGRRNIEQLALHLKGRLTDWFRVRLDYHSFARDKTDRSAFNFLGNTGFGTNGTSDDIGSEFDLVVLLKAPYGLNLMLGATLFEPGQYMKDQNGGMADTTEFYYGQININF